MLQDRVQMAFRVRSERRQHMSHCGLPTGKWAALDCALICPIRTILDESSVDADGLPRPSSPFKIADFPLMLTQRTAAVGRA